MGPNDNQARSGEIARELFTEMVKGMVTLSQAMTQVVQKVEDLTAAIDDQRQVNEELAEAVSDLSGLVETCIRVVDESSEAAVEDERDVEWSDVQAAFQKLKKDSGVPEEEEVEDEKE